jgi:23S rRNA (cytidine1920-2'-O)/16S rRNA (cytidine1409-2'-O)-methyltransferase
MGSVQTDYPAMLRYFTIEPSPSPGQAYPGLLCYALIVSSESLDRPYASRAGLKLAAALAAFGIQPTDLVCADFGSNVGGFVDCLLRRGAAKVYAVDTGYGVLAWTLRKDARVVVMERTNAMHVDLPEQVDLVTIDVAWTPQHIILPNAVRQLRPGGRIITLVKPHYEADKSLLKRGVLPPESAQPTLDAVCTRICELGLIVQQVADSPIPGSKGNREYLALIAPKL